MADKRKKGFLDLPPELRNVIYELCLDIGNPCICPTLLATSKKINAEGTPVFHELSTFTVQMKELNADIIRVSIGGKQALDLRQDELDVLRAMDYYPSSLRTIKRMRIEIELEGLSQMKRTGRIPIFHQLCILAFLAEGNTHLKLEFVAATAASSFAALYFFPSSADITHVGSASALVSTDKEQANLGRYWKDFTALVRADAAVKNFMKAKQEAGVTDGTGTLLGYTVHRARRAIPSHKMTDQYCTPMYFLEKFDEREVDARKRLVAAKSREAGRQTAVSKDPSAASQKATSTSSQT